MCCMGCCRSDVVTFNGFEALCALGGARLHAHEQRGLAVHLSRVQSALHAGPDFWHAMLRSHNIAADAVCGSIATKLIVLSAADGSAPMIVHSRQPAEHCVLHVQHALTRKGIGAPVAAAFARVCVARIQAINDATLSTLDTFFSSLVPHCIIRLALRHVNSVEVNLDDASFWFGDGHANVLVIHQPTRTGVLIEPAGASTAPLLVHSIKRVLRVPHLKLIHNLYFRRQDNAAPDFDDGLCTLWCAIYGLLVIACGITTPEDFWALFKQVEARRAETLRGFLRLAASMLLPLSGVLQ